MRLELAVPWRRSRKISAEEVSQITEQISKFSAVQCSAIKMKLDYFTSTSALLLGGNDFNPFLWILIQQSNVSCLVMACDVAAADYTLSAFITITSWSLNNHLNLKQRGEVMHTLRYTTSLPHQHFTSTHREVELSDAPFRRVSRVRRKVLWKLTVCGKRDPGTTFWTRRKENKIFIELRGFETFYPWELSYFTWRTESANSPWAWDHSTLSYDLMSAILLLLQRLFSNDLL